MFKFIWHQTEFSQHGLGLVWEKTDSRPNTQKQRNVLELVYIYTYLKLCSVRKATIRSSKISMFTKNFWKQNDSAGLWLCYISIFLLLEKVTAEKKLDYLPPPHGSWPTSADQSLTQSLLPVKGESAWLCPPAPCRQQKIKCEVGWVRRVGPELQTACVEIWNLMLTKATVPYCLPILEHCICRIKSFVSG